MSNELIIPMRDADIYTPTLRALLEERLEPFPGRAGRGHSVGTTILAEDGCKTEVETEFYVWVTGPEGELVQDDLMTSSTELRDQCGAAAFAFHGDLDTTFVLRSAVSAMMPFSRNTTYEAICQAGGILILEKDFLDYVALELRKHGPAIFDQAVLDGLVRVLVPATSSNHERLAFSQAATAFLSCLVQEHLRTTPPRDHADRIENVSIFISLTKVTP